MKENDTTDTPYPLNLQMTGILYFRIFLSLYNSRYLHTSSKSKILDRLKLTKNTRFGIFFYSSTVMYAQASSKFSP